MNASGSNPVPSAPRLDYAAHADAELLAAGLELVRVLQAAGHLALFVGGSVRDVLLGRRVEDLDIATSARPEQVSALFGEARSVGAHFGVQLVTRRRADGAPMQFEIATFRAEGNYVDHRRPAAVRYGTLAEDFGRRDFTINAMYYDPLAGRLYDPAHGHEDLAAGLLRAVGDPLRRFDEDALRLLRAARFAVRFDLAIEAATTAAIRARAPTLAAISAERIADELTRMLTGPHPGRAMRLLDELELWPWVIPEIVPMKGCAQPANFHPEGDVFVHTALVLDGARESWQMEAGASAPMPPELAFGALLHDVGKPPTQVFEDRIRFPEHQKVGAEMADAICRRLRLPNETRELTVELVANHMRFMEARNMKRSTLRRFLALGRFDLHLALHRADCLGSHRQLDNYWFCRGALNEFAGEEADRAALPPPLLTGRDLIEAGLRPGPLFGELLAALAEEQLEGRLRDRGEALAWLADKIDHIKTNEN